MLSGFVQNPLNNFSGLKMDSFNPKAANSVEAAIGLDLINPFLGALIK